MFEFSVAFKYLIPKWRQLSVSIISLVSILVIALVVWLIVVFFSVKDGLENSWIDKIIALTAPMRITPTEKYYASYYHLADTISQHSDYTAKTLSEKLAQSQDKTIPTDPYNPNTDEEIPSFWAAPDRTADGKLKDLVGIAHNTATTLSSAKNIKVTDFETTIANLRLRLLRNLNSNGNQSQQFLDQAAYIGTFDPDSPTLAKALMPLKASDYSNLMQMQGILADNITEDNPDSVHKIDPKIKKERLDNLFKAKEFEGVALLPKGWKIPESYPSADSSPKYIAAISTSGGLVLPLDNGFGEPILLPKNFRDAGVLVGDQGFISYHSATPSSIQEQRLPVVVTGFYDPGIMPIGGKYILSSRNLVSIVRAAHAEGGVVAGNGLNVRFDNLKDAPKIKAELQKAFEENGIAPYWNIETYQEYEFTKDLIQQLQSEKNLFSVISLVIIIVACSNIISMLIILVNDKKLEIGILRSMGASSGSIALIFGFCGMVMGALGSLIGIGASILTLRHLNELVDFIGSIQGHDLFNPVFYGNTLPTDLSLEALSLVVIATAFISLLAGIVPAVKASTMRPSAILRAE